MNQGLQTNRVKWFFNWNLGYMVFLPDCKLTLYLNKRPRRRNNSFYKQPKIKKKHVINILDSPSGYHFLDCGVAYELSGRPKKSWRHTENKQISYNLWTKPKDSVRWGSFQQKLQHLCFYVWLPAFITSLFSDYVCTFYFVCSFLNFSQKVSDGS